MPELSRLVSTDSRGGRRRLWLLRHASDTAVRLQVAGDQASRKHIGDTGRRREAGAT